MQKHPSYELCLDLTTKNAPDQQVSIIQDQAIEAKHFQCCTASWEFSAQLHCKNVNLHQLIRNKKLSVRTQNFW